LGGGHFSEVWQGVWNQTIPVAVKMLRSGTSGDHNDLDKQKFLAEANMMKTLSHPKLVRLYAVCTTNTDEVEQPVYILMELMTKGNLSNYLRSEEVKELPVNHLIEMSAQVAEGMKFLESIKFVHRDVAARNILVGERNKVKISDFGMSVILDEGSDNIVEDDNIKVATAWCAPEVLSDNIFSSASDVWSFGVLMYEVVCQGEVPSSVGGITSSLGEKTSSLGEKTSSMGEITSSLGAKTSSVGEKTSYMGEITSPEGEKTSSVGDIMSSVGEVMSRPYTTTHIPQHYLHIMQQCWSLEPSQRPTFAQLHAQLVTT